MDASWDHSMLACGCMHDNPVPSAVAVDLRDETVIYSFENVGEDFNAVSFSPDNRLLLHLSAYSPNTRCEDICIVRTWKMISKACYHTTITKARFCHGSRPNVVILTQCDAG